MAELKEDVRTYLARIRKTIADSKNMVAQAELRIAETDRMLERQGLTREQVMAMRMLERQGLTREQVMAMQFSDAQKRAVDAELKRRGLDPLEWWSEVERPAPEEESRLPDAGVGTASDAELANRQRKFGMMMKPFQI